MTTAKAKAGSTAEISTAAHPSIKEVDRPANLTSENAPAWGSDVIAETLRDLENSLYRAQSGRELSRPARFHRQLSRQRDAADDPVPARGSRGLDRARLRQGHRQGDGGRGAFQCRPVPRHDGVLQRLVRPHAGGSARRDRSGGCGQAPALDRLDSHRARPGRASCATTPSGTTSRLRPRRRASR